VKRRWDVIAGLVDQHGLRIGAEIGVAEGRFTAGLLTLCPDLLLVAVDDFAPGYKTWMGTEWTAQQQAANRSEFRKVMRAYPERIGLLEMTSESAARFWAEILDFVFIDADHSYEAVKADIAAWLPKIRNGGWITGHDYDPEKFPGVVRAVEESFADFHLGDDFTWMSQVL
jgi:hypothetical protein